MLCYVTIWYLKVPYPTLCSFMAVYGSLTQGIAVCGTKKLLRGNMKKQTLACKCKNADVWGFQSKQ